MDAVLTTSRPSNRARFLRWLRRVHGWMGLWGAVLGLLFGVTGFLLNHRHVMKIQASHMEQSQFQLALPTTRPDSARDMSVWLQQQLHIEQEPGKVQQEAESEIRIGETTYRQPAQWKVEFHAPNVSWQADYLVGNQYVSIKRMDVNALGLLMRLHKGVGMEKGWVLLVDSLAGALILLAITGTLLWSGMRGSRLVMLGLCGTSLGLAAIFTMQSIY